MRNLRPNEIINLKKAKDLIKSEMIKSKIYYKKSCFSCYNDGVFTYNYKTKDGILVETSFICNDSLLNKLSFKEILELKEIKFLWQRIFLTNKKDYEVVGEVLFNLED